jgi:hypothetical protein
MDKTHELGRRGLHWRDQVHTLHAQLNNQIVRGHYDRIPALEAPSPSEGGERMAGSPSSSGSLGDKNQQSKEILKIFVASAAEVQRTLGSRVRRLPEGVNDRSTTSAK